jgi:phosphatidylinositol glycan class W
LISYLSIMWPIILHITILTDYIFTSYMFLFVLNGIILKLMLNLKVNKEKFSFHSIKKTRTLFSNNDHDIVKLSVNAFRSSVFLITSVAILAIDFDIFPLKHLKRKTFGIALMDLGVGLFILCHSLRLIRNNSQNKRKENEKKNNHLILDLKKLPVKMYYTFKSSSLLLILGFIRLMLIKITNYKVSSNEYGTHWNFFFSIFFVKVIFF